MILWLVMLARKRFRLGKSDDLDYLFRIGWVTPANRNESRGKKPNLTRRRGEGRGGKQEGIHRIVTNLPPPRSPHLRVNKTPGGAQSYGMKRVRLAKSDDQDSFNSEANFGEQSLENRRPRPKIVSPVPSFFMLFYLDRLVIFLILG